MGIYDRDYYRREGYSFLGSFSERGTICKWLIGINIVAKHIGLAADRRVHRCVHKIGGIEDESLATQTVYSRGSVIVPVSALAATVSGLARKTRASLCPMRPG